MVNNRDKPMEKVIEGEESQEHLVIFYPRKTSYVQIY